MSRMCRLLLAVCDSCRTAALNTPTRAPRILGSESSKPRGRPQSEGTSGDQSERPSAAIRHRNDSNISDLPPNENIRAQAEKECDKLGVTFSYKQVSLGWDSLRNSRSAVVDLQISIRKSGDVTILDLRGRATIGPDSDLLSGHLQRLVANGVRKLLLNLGDVTQVDSSGISAITATYLSLSRQGGSLKLLCPCGRVQTVLQVIRLPKIIPTFEDETQALASFRPQGFSARR